MTWNSGPAATGGGIGCAAPLLASGTGAPVSVRRCVMWLPLTGCGDLDLLPVGDGAHPDSGPNRDPADGPCGHDDRGVNHA